MGIKAAVPPPPLTIIRALGWGLVTAITTGLFAMLLLVVLIIIRDPTEFTGSPLAVVGGFLRLFLIGSIWAVMFSVLIGWLPITIIGWFTHKAAQHFSVMTKAMSWAFIGIMTGGLCLVILNGGLEGLIAKPAGSSKDDLRDMLAFGGTCGLFAALLFRRFTIRAEPSEGLAAIRP